MAALDCSRQTAEANQDGDFREVEYRRRGEDDGSKQASVRPDRVPTSVGMGHVGLRRYRSSRPDGA